MPHYQPALASGSAPSLGSLGSEAVPSLAVASDDLEWFDLPDAARSLLALVDGEAPIGSIATRAGVAVDAALATFHDLHRDGVVTLRRRSST
jgi:hypothetical protein